MKQILLKPVISEKSMQDAAAGRFTFLVSRLANKEEISKSVEANFAVRVVRVTTVTLPAKSRRVGRRRLLKIGVQSKKARVTLAPGQKIDLFDVAEGGVNHA